MKSKMANRPPIHEVRQTLAELRPDGTSYTNGVIEALEWAINGEASEGLESVVHGHHALELTEVGSVEYEAAKPLEVVTDRTKIARSISGNPLTHLVPNETFSGEYISRKVGGRDDLDVLKAVHDLGHNVLLYGPTGSAKTSFVYAYAAKEKLPVVNIACNGAIDTRQLFGGWVPTADGSFRFEPGELPLAVEHGAIILLNEVNFAPAKILAALYGLLDKRRTLFLADAAGSDYPTVVKAHPRTLVVADFNPGYAGTRPLNAAFKNRFAIKLEWDYEERVEALLIKSSGLREMASQLRERIAAGDLSTPVPTNSLMEFEELASSDALGYEFAVANFVSAFDPTEKSVIEEVFAVWSDRIRLELYGEEVITNG